MSSQPFQYSNLVFDTDPNSLAGLLASGNLLKKQSESNQSQTTKQGRSQDLGRQQNALLYGWEQDSQPEEPLFRVSHSQETPKPARTRSFINPSASQGPPLKNQNISTLLSAEIGPSSTRVHSSSQSSSILAPVPSIQKSSSSTSPSLNFPNRIDHVSPLKIQEQFRGTQPHQRQQQAPKKIQKPSVPSQPVLPVINFGQKEEEDDDISSQKSVIQERWSQASSSSSSREKKKSLAISQTPQANTPSSSSCTFKAPRLMQLPVTAYKEISTNHEKQENRYQTSPCFNGGTDRCRERTVDFVPGPANNGWLVDLEEYSQRLGEHDQQEISSKPTRKSENELLRYKFEDLFCKGPWLSFCLEYQQPAILDLDQDSSSLIARFNCDGILRQGLGTNAQKVPFLALVLVKLSMFEHYAVAKMADPTGILEAEFHENAFKTERWRIQEGCVIVLKDVTICRPLFLGEEISMHTLIVTLNNIDKVFSPTEDIPSSFAPELVQSIRAQKFPIRSVTTSSLDASRPGKSSRSLMTTSPAAPPPITTSVTESMNTPFSILPNSIPLPSHIAQKNRILDDFEGLDEDILEEFLRNAEKKRASGNELAPSKKLSEIAAIPVEEEEMDFRPQESVRSAPFDREKPVEILDLLDSQNREVGPKHESKKLMLSIIKEPVSGGQSKLAWIPAVGDVRPLFSHLTQKEVPRSEEFPASFSPTIPNCNMNSVEKQSAVLSPLPPTASPHFALSPANDISLLLHSQHDKTEVIREPILLSESKREKSYDDVGWLDD